MEQCKIQQEDLGSVQVMIASMLQQIDSVPEDQEHWMDLTIQLYSAILSLLIWPQYHEIKEKLFDLDALIEFANSDDELNIYAGTSLYRYLEEMPGIGYLPGSSMLGYEPGGEARARAQHDYLARQWTAFCQSPLNWRACADAAPVM